MTTTILFTRHSENTDHHEGIFCSTNPGDTLTTKGRAQAEQTAAHLASMNISALYTSPLARAVQSAEIIGVALGLEPIVLDGLHEVNVGVLSGERATERIWADWRRVTEAWQAGRVKTRYPGGEDFVELWARFRGSVGTMVEQNPGSTVAAITHGGLLRYALKDLCPADNIGWYRGFDIANMSITEIAVEKPRVMTGSSTYRGKLVRWAATDHLAVGVK